MKRETRYVFGFLKRPWKYTAKSISHWKQIISIKIIIPLPPPYFSVIYLLKAKYNSFNSVGLLDFFYDNS
ncbi:MAG: hypothetical protein KGY74_08230 [Candidatus Cloacimonetes bacterium]|nr:hypothetical protein [Candidatus Cloacimonadota bacterium]